MIDSNIQMSIDIARLAKLDYKYGDVSIVHDDGLEWSSLSSLKNTGLLPTRKQIEGKMDNIEGLEIPENEYWDEKNRKDFGIPIEEILGKYEPKHRSIKILDKMCKLVAVRLDLNLDALLRLVTAHEIAHAVTHLGQHADSKWNSFESAEPYEAEFFAQMYALHYFRKKGDEESIEVFKTLSNFQDDMYRSWKQYEWMNTEMLNGALAWARFEKPLPFETDPTNDEIITIDPGEEFVLNWLSEIIIVLEKAEVNKKIDHGKLTDCKNQYDVLKTKIRYCYFTNHYGEDRISYALSRIDNALSHINHADSYGIEITNIPTDTSR